MRKESRGETLLDMLSHATLKSILLNFPLLLDTITSGVAFQPVLVYPPVAFWLAQLLGRL